MPLTPVPKNCIERFELAGGGGGLFDTSGALPLLHAAMAQQENRLANERAIVTADPMQKARSIDDISVTLGGPGSRCPAQRLGPIPTRRYPCASPGLICVK